MKILIAIHHRFELWQPPDSFREGLAAAFPEHTFAQIPTLDHLGDAISDADVLIGFQMRPEQFARARKLKFIQTTTAAVHQLMFPEMVASPVRVANAAAVHGPVVAEHAIALIFALAKSLPAAMKAQQEKRWAQSDLWMKGPRPREVAGSTLGVIGLGAIGREAVRLAKGLGMRVIALREHPERGEDGADEVYGTSAMLSLLGRSDFVLLAAPLTAKTSALFDDRAFAAMKREAYFINVSRGPLVDEAALDRALRESKIAGAALEVFVQEPLPPESPLWTAPNLLITPHSASLTSKLWERHLAYISENLRRFFAGEPLRGEVEKARGY
jgi:phosphoglycerate dehydrogenase-like enzyme